MNIIETIHLWRIGYVNMLISLAPLVSHMCQGPRWVLSKQLPKSSTACRGERLHWPDGRHRPDGCHG